MPSSARLLLIGHGSTRYPEAGEPIHRHANRLRADGHAVRVGFLNGAPSVQDALTGLAGASVQVIPCFMEEGFFTQVAIPRALNGAAVHLCRPVGAHPAMPTLIRDHGVATCERLALPVQQTALVVIGHGSASAPGRRLALYDHVGVIAATGCFAKVQSACLEEAPFVADVLATMRGHPVVVVGYFANLGSHMLEDVPALLQAEQVARGQAGQGVYFAGSVMDHPGMTRLILDIAQPGTF